MAVTEVRPATGVGSSTSSAALLLPTSPRVLAPQQRTVPSVRTAQLCPPRVVIILTSESPETCTGETAWVRAPLPSSPWRLLPQHLAVRSASKTHAALPPASIDIVRAVLLLQAKQHHPITSNRVIEPDITKRDARYMNLPPTVSVASL